MSSWLKSRLVSGSVAEAVDQEVFLLEEGGLRAKERSRLEVWAMATSKQQDGARENLDKAREVQDAHGRGRRTSKQSSGMSTAEKNALAADDFAFPDERKEPLHDAEHVRNAIARFDQVEGVSDAERDRAWKRIRSAAKRFDVEISAADWRELS
jgi:uncharacterized sporulation protein YeaH/YhbH (DUF444 family)